MPRFITSKLCGVLCLSFASAALAQNAAPTYTAGQTVRASETETYRIMNCRPEKISRQIQCDMVLWVDGSAASNKFTMFASQLAAAEARLAEREELAALTDEQAVEAPPATEGDEAAPVQPDATP